MAQPAEHTYFPPLEDCLRGQSIILSWKSIATALSDHSAEQQTNPAVIDFLSHDLVQALLFDPTSGFAPPTEQTRSSFETRTSAVSVPPSPDAKYDVATIRAHATWLSESANINLVAALRVVAIEFQSRPASHLAGPLSSQDAANLREAAGLKNGQDSVLILNLGAAASATADAETLWADFEAEDTAKSRIFATYLSERRHFAMTVDYVNSIRFYRRLPIGLSAGPAATADLVAMYGLERPPDAGAVISAHLQLLRAVLLNVESGLEGTTRDPLLLTEDMAIEWGRTALTEAAHLLSVIFHALDGLGRNFAPAAAAGDWFNLMSTYAFLAKLDPAREILRELVPPIQTLVGAISLAFISPFEALLSFEGERDEALSLDQSYLAASDVLEQIHQSILLATNTECESAAPAIFAWALVVTRMFASLNERQEKRDSILHQNARETFEGSISDRPALDRRRNSAGSIVSIEPTRFDHFLQETGLDKDMQVISGMANAVMANGKTFDVLTGMAQTAGSLAHTSLAPLLGYRIRIVCLAFLKACYPRVGYQADPVECLIAVLTKDHHHLHHHHQQPQQPQQHQQQQQQPCADLLSPLPNIVNVALQDNLLLEFYLEQALTRFPYEFLPLIRLCRVLCSPSPGLPDGRSDIVLDLLRRTPTLTLILPAGFEQYEWETPSDDSNNEDPDTFSLVTDLVLISATSSWKRSRRITDSNGDGDGDGAADANHDVRIPAGTQGRFVTNSSPIVVMQFPHSALALLGRRLQVNLDKDSCDTRLPHPDTEEIGDAISLIAELVKAEHVKEEAASAAAAAASLSSQTSRPGAGGAATAATTAAAAAAATAIINPERDVLAEASWYLGGSQDILSVVCDTMDRCMQDGLSASEDTDLGILHACIQFLHAALPRCPGRVFSYIARCDLLDSESRAGRLGMIVGNLDLVLERYDFLMSTVRLLSSMVDSVMASAVQRRCGDQFASRKRGEADGQLWIGIADRLLERVCYSMAQAVVDTFENSATWRFASDFDRISLLLAVIPVMNKMVVYTLDRDDGGSDALLACLRRAARHVTDSFLSPSAGSLRFQAILGTLASTFNYSIDSTLLPNKQRLLVSQLSVICDFTKHLLRETVYQNRASTTFETRLFMASALIARLGSVSTAFRRPTLELFEVLIRTTGRIQTEPPSLLGYLGTQISKSFLQTLARLDRPFNSGADLTALWRLFSSIVSSRQQWMSNCLLTGKTPREGLRNEQGAIEPSPDSVLVAVLTRAQALDEIDSREALAALEFVTAALNHWPRTIMVLERNRSFIDRLRSYVRGLRAPSVTTRTDPVRAAVEARLAAYVAQIWSMQLYHLRQMGRADGLAASLVADLDYYLRDGAPVSGYNKSLHVNFAKNFANKYPGCTLAAFKRSLLEPRELGVGFYYDLERADDMLRFDPGWTRGRGNNFRSEMELANANLSLVDAQLALFSAWRVLLLELGTCLRDSPGIIARQMLQVAQQCLVANQESQGPEAIFTSIADSRASLALMLVQKLTGTALAPGEVNELLGNLFANLNRLDEPFSPEFISYTRILLKLIYVTLRAFTASQRLAAAQAGGGGGGGSLISLTQTILNLLDRVVARGFRTMVSFLHEPDTVVSPGDVSLLTAILQASLCALPDADKCQTQILNIMAAHDAARVAVSLFSWADKLAVDGGPVYGELSLLFLLELSSLPVVAEQLACDGVLANIMSANLIGYMRRNGGGPGMMTCLSSSSAAPENNNSNNGGSSTNNNNHNTNNNGSSTNSNNNNNSSISATNNAVAQRCYDIWAKGLLPLMLNFLTAMGAAIAPEVAYVLGQFPHLLRSSIDRFEAPGISRTSSIRDPARYLTLLAVSEVHSLALLTRILAGLRANNTRDIPEVHWDAQAALENAEYWLATRRLLRERLIPTGPREADWAATPTGRRGEEGQAENMLEERAVAQLEAIRDALAEEEDESE